MNIYHVIFHTWCNHQIVRLSVNKAYQTSACQEVFSMFGSTIFCLIFLSRFWAWILFNITLNASYDSKDFSKVYLNVTFSAWKTGLHRPSFNQSGTENENLFKVKCKLQSCKNTNSQRDGKKVWCCCKTI